MCISILMVIVICICHKQFYSVYSGSENAVMPRPAFYAGRGRFLSESKHEREQALTILIGDALFELALLQSFRISAALLGREIGCF